MTQIGKKVPRSSSTTSEPQRQAQVAFLCLVDLRGAGDSSPSSIGELSLGDLRFRLGLASSDGGRAVRRFEPTATFDASAMSASASTCRWPVARDRPLPLPLPFAPPPARLLSSRCTISSGGAGSGTSSSFALASTSALRTSCEFSRRGVLGPFPFPLRAFGYAPGIFDVPDDDAWDGSGPTVGRPIVDGGSRRSATSDMDTSATSGAVAAVGRPQIVSRMVLRRMKTELSGLSVRR
jgi:hypothetical protein